MAEKERKPIVRFKGFPQGWESCKLGDISERVIRKNINSESTLPLTISAQYGLVDQITFFNSQVASKDVSNYYLLKNGEFAYNKSTSQDYPVGAVKRLDRYDMGVLSTLYILFKPKNAISSDYLVTYFDSNCWHKEITIRATEGARNHGLLNICPDDFFDIELKKPQDMKEQEKVGVFLRNIDELIAKEQTKYEKTQNLKKSMLEKMFPKDGEDMPEIRFKGFIGAWEKHNLKYYLETSQKKNEQLLFSKMDVLSVSGEFGIINQIKLKGRSYAGISVKNYGVVHTSDIVYTKSPLKDTPYGIIKANMGDDGIVSTLYAIYHPQKHTYSPFVQYYFELDARLNRYLKPLVNKGAKNDMKVSSDGALLGYVFFPGLEEQRKVAEFFTKLDALILKRVQELEKLKNLKKALLEKMFV